MMRFAGFLVTLFINGLSASASMCPELGKSSSISDDNLAWACELKSWTISMAEWKEQVEKECSTGGEYWQSLFECPDYSNVTCRNEHAAQHEYDAYSCHIVTCMDGRYSDQKVIRKIWRKHFNAYNKIYEFYQKELRFCNHRHILRDCSEFDASTEETPTTTAMNYNEEMSTQEYENTATAEDHAGATTQAAVEEDTTQLITADPLTTAACSGGTSIVNELNGTISSPNYPDNYTNNVLCSWGIIVPNGMVITVQSGWSYDIEDDSTCSFDYLQFFHGQESCGQNSNNPSFQTTANHLIVLFKTDDSETKSGFSFNWVASKASNTTRAVVEEDAASATAACSGGTFIVDELNGTISSPNYPDIYPNDAQCSWYISVPEGMVITVQPGWSYNIEDDDTCSFDYLQFFDGQKSCGQNSSNPSFQTTVNYLIVLFKTDDSATESGFSFNWVASTVP